MKKLFTLFAAIIFLVATAFVAEKFIVVRMTETQINYHWQNLNAIKQVVSGSNLPHQQAIFVLSSIDSLQKDIQSSAKLDSTASAPKK